MGQYDQAIATRTRSDKLNSQQYDGQSHPADVAFLAMAHYRLGHTAEARKLLDRPRQLLQQDHWKNNADSRAFLREAELLINSLPPEQ